MQKRVSRESRNRQGTVGYLLVAQLVGDGEGQVETVVFGKYAFPLRTAHTAQVCNSCSGDTKHILIRMREAPALPGRPRPRPEGLDFAWKAPTSPGRSAWSTSAGQTGMMTSPGLDLSFQSSEADWLSHVPNDHNDQNHHKCLSSI